MNGKFFAKLVRHYFPLAFNLSIKLKSKRVLQNNCPIQNLEEAQYAFKRIRAHLFCIPANSPDINQLKSCFIWPSRSSSNKHETKILNVKHLMNFLCGWRILCQNIYLVKSTNLLNPWISEYHIL